MGYYAYDVNGYVGDVASISGWEEFVEWAEEQGGDIQTLIDDGVVEGDALDVLREQLDGASAKGDVESIRVALLKAVKAADEILIVSDGTGDEAVTESEEFAAKLRAPNDIESKVDWFAVAQTLDDHEARGVAGAAAVVQKMRDALIAAIERKGLVIGEINKLQLKYKGDLRAAFRETLTELYESGRKDARKELPKKFAADWTPLTPAMALKFFDAKAFTMTGVEEEYILKQIKIELFNSIKMGRTIAQTTHVIRDIFKPYFETSEVKDGEVMTAHRLENVIRTNGNEAYNQGRIEIYRDPELEGFVPAVMFSAILDERVTSVCSSLDGLVFEIGDPALDQFTPPMHYQCRSTLIPVTRDEEYTVISDKQKGAALELAPQGFK